MSKFWNSPFIGSCLLILSLSSVLSSPLNEEIRMVLISETIVPAPINQTMNSTSSSSSEKLRQDGDGVDAGDAIEAGAAALGGDGEVGTNVANILQGVLGGGFENIFKGTTAFIGDDDTAQGVSTILASLTKPLNTIFATGFESGQKYFGIGVTTPAPTLNGTVPVSGAATATGGAGVLPQASVVVDGAASAPLPAATVTESKDPDDDDDSESAKLRRE